MPWKVTGTDNVPGEDDKPSWTVETDLTQQEAQQIVEAIQGTIQGTSGIILKDEGSQLQTKPVGAPTVIYTAEPEV